jgi:zinc transport system substrate-binding protein
MRGRVRFGAIALAVAALGAGLAAGCTPTTHASAKPRVAASFYPLAFVAERVAGDHAEVVNLTTPGGEPHDLELTINEAVEVAEADLVVVLGGFQPAVDDTVATTAEGRVLDVNDVVEVRADDPHFWLDPLLLADLGDAVADQLGEVDPGQRTDYAAGAAALRAELTDLDAAYDAGLEGCDRDLVVVSHDAFGYLDRYGLGFEAISGISPGAEPTPGDLARLEQLVTDEGITTVFFETLTSPELAETLAAEVGVRTAVLDPIEGLADTTADEDYLSLARENLAALKEANGCPNA